MMKPLPPTKGVLVALWTPLDARGRLLRPALGDHLAWLRAQGIHGVFALGSTGEFPLLSLAQREEVLAAVVELAAPLPVVANISSIRLDEVVTLGRAARRLGAVGVALMPPPFFPMSQADMLEFFLRAAERIDLPVILYNFPELTGNRIGLETIAAFAERADLAGIKQSGGEFAYHRELIALGREKGFPVFSGADTRLPEAFALGATGCISGLVNFVPDLVAPLYRIAHEGLPGDLAELGRRMQEVGRVADQLTFPLNVAAGIAARGFDPGAPKTVVSAASLRLLEQVEADFRRLFDRYGLAPGRSQPETNSIPSPA